MNNITKKVAIIKIIVKIRNIISNLVVEDATGRNEVRMTKNITIVRSIVVVKERRSLLPTGRKM